MFTQKRAFSFLILSVILAFFLAGCVLPFSSEEGDEVEATPTADPNQGGGIEQPAEESSVEQPAAEVETEVETEPAEETAVTEETTVEETTTTETTTETSTETQPAEETTSETAVQPEQEPSETSPMPPTPTPMPPPTTTTTTTACPVTHTVQAGENLYRIGLQYGMSWVPIANANGLTNPNALSVGQVLIIPVAGCTPVPPPVEGTTYIVQPGDNLFRIGLKFGISWVQIAEANGIVNPNQIYVGQVLKIPVEQPGPTPNFTHLVQYGETLFTISIHYGVPWQAIAAANQIPPPYIVYAGQTIIIPGSW